MFNLFIKLFIFGFIYYVTVKLLLLVGEKFYYKIKDKIKREI